MEIKDKRRHAIADSLSTLAQALIDETIIRDVENDAADTADQGDNEKLPMAKIALSFQWPAGAERAEIEAKLAWSIRRLTTADCVVDPNQTSIDFEEGGES